MPHYAKDIKLNISNVLSLEGAPGLSEAQIAGVALSSAYAIKNSFLIEMIETYAKGMLSDEAIQAAKAAACIMAMNNIYYRFVHLSTDDNYSAMGANLRMQIMANPGVEKIDFELYSLAISAINGCGMCIDSHAKTIERGGVSKHGVQSAIRIAAVLNAAAQVLAIEHQK